MKSGAECDEGAGLGGRGRWEIAGVWLPLVREEGLNVVGIVDVERTRAEARAQEFAPGAQVFTDVREALHACRADIVLDLTVPEARCEVTCAVLEAGCHVLWGEADGGQYARRAGDGAHGGEGATVVHGELVAAVGSASRTCAADTWGGSDRQGDDHHKLRFLPWRAFWWFSGCDEEPAAVGHGDSSF